MINSDKLITCLIKKERDIFSTVIKASKMGKDIGFSASDQHKIATATSELAHNILRYAEIGKIELKVLELGVNKGMAVIAEDAGPGIENVERAFQEHYSTGGTLGLGLPGVKRLMDELSIDTSPERGTRIIATKWI